jgi:putative transposase
MQVMSKMARVVVPGLPHHITQRGTDQKDVFFDDQDRRVYLRLLKEHGEEYSLGYLGYCLMTNHVHVIAIPYEMDSLARTFGQAHAAYSRYLHGKRGGCGHLWQARFYSCVLSEAHRWWALGYVENNPVHAHLVRRAVEYRWSSARAHTGLGQADIPLLDSLFCRDYANDDWLRVLDTDVYEESLVRRLREATKTGRPFGDKAFVQRLEADLARQLLPRKRGPKRAEVESTEGDGVKTAS